MNDLLRLMLVACALPVVGMVAAERPGNESDYFAQRVQENLRRFGQYAAEGKVNWKAPEAETVSVMSAVWAPESYQNYLRSSFAGLKNEPSPVNLKTAEILLDPTAHAMAQLSTEISTEILKRPLNAELHDHAAMLIAVLILREASGRFYDTRELLSRATAHLAFARYLTSEPSPVGVVARAIIEAEQGRALRAMELSQRLAQPFGDWKRIITIRATGDWQSPGESKSLLYNILHTQALLASSKGQASQRVVDGIRLQDDRVQGRTDWYRSFLQDPPSRRFVLNKQNEALQLEGAEMTGVMTTFKIAPATSEASINVMNQAPGYIISPDGVGMPSVAVLDWGTWASHYQRHLCHNLMFVLGEQMIERKFHGLDFYPFIILQQRRQPNGLKRKIFIDALSLVDQKPHLVNAVNRAQLKSLLEQAIQTHIDPFTPLSSTPYLSPENRNQPTLGFVPTVMDMREGISKADSWISGLPTGSNYRAEERYTRLSHDMIVRVGKANPYSAFYALKRVEAIDGASLSTYDKAAGPRADYDLYVMRAILDKLSPNDDDHLALLDRISKISPSATLAKANLLYQTGKTEQAAQIFNKAVEANLPPKLLSESALWMTDYLQDKGEDERALEVAETAAGEGGLLHRQRYIRLLEAQDKRTEAEKTIFSMQKHFPISIPLISFYVQLGRLNGTTQGERNVSTALGEIKYRPRLLETERKAALDAAEAIIFPGGKSTFRSNSSHPTGGMRVKSVKADLGVTETDLLVAFNSVVVSDVYQYHFLRRETDAPEATLTLWSNAKGYFVTKINVKKWDDNVTLTYAKPSGNRLDDRISAARKTGKLNLSRLGLRSLPQKVLELEGLKVLNLSGNPLEVLPKGINAMVNLESLDVTNCALNELPPELGALKALVSLKAGENYLETLPDSLAGLPKLELLNLKENDLSDCPAVITRITSLKYLVLSNNQISTLPDELGKLRNLQAISLGRNNFTQFPEQLLELTALRRLVLLDNNITSLPESVNRMKSLVRLDMRGNQLASLPESLPSIEGLAQLQLGRNAFISLPDSLWQQKSLVELDVGGNGLISISPSIAKLERLKLLVISSNKLSKFPPTLPEMSALRKVEYGGNYFVPEHTLVMINLAKNVTFSGDTYE